MIRTIVAGLGACACVAFVGLAWNTRAAQNDPPGVIPAADQPLPIRQVVLFNSGVGYLQREGDVAGDAKVELSFRAADINDLLKSLVLQDLGGGKVSTVSYDNFDPLDRILRSFAIDLNNNPTFGQILNQARDERIEIQLAAKDKGIPTKVVGAIVGMESKSRSIKDEVIEEESLNLSGASGLQSIPLSQITSVKFMNPVLESEFQRALKVLASSHDMDKKSVAVHFTGQGKRAVRVGYVVERPIWKTSYRLRFEPDGKMTMQGWAIVENTSDDDWNDVRMVLVSGRPISFRMNLYEPLYIPRPLVEPELFGSLRPQTYGGTMPGGGAGGPLQGLIGNVDGQRPVGQGGLGGVSGTFQGGAFAGANPYQQGNLFRNQVDNNRVTFEQLQERQKAMRAAKQDAKERGSAIALNFKEGIQSVASAEEIGDYFQYMIDQRISLSRQKSAMLPIINQTLEGAKVSIYNDSVHAKFPLLGLRLKNTSGQPLTQGPITVYDQATYAGDTRILDLQPNEVRLISYALDQGTEVKHSVKRSPSPEMTFKIGESNLTAAYTERETKTYTLKNRSTHDRVVVIEHPIRAGWTLVEPKKANEQTRDTYRFEVKLPAGQSASLSVAEDQPRVDHVALRGGQPGYVANTGLAVREIVKSHEIVLKGLKVVKGVLTPTLRARETRVRYIQNLSDIDRDFQIDHIIRPEWSLLMPKGEAIPGPAVHRTTVRIEKGKAGESEISEERIYNDKPILVREIPESTLREYINHQNVAVRVKEGLTRSLEMSKRLAETTREVASLERQLKTLSDDQARLRSNLQIIPPSAEPYKNFLNKFVAQETEIDNLQRQIRNAQSAMNAAQREYETFLMTWTDE